MPKALVIGNGLAGTIAATQLRKDGAEVILASRSWGATAMSTGALDIAYSPALSPTHSLPRTIAEHIMDIVAHRRRHPFGVMGVETTIRGIQQGADLLRAGLGGTGLPIPALDLEAANGVYPSSLGVASFAGAVLDAHRGGELSGLGGRRVGMLRFTGYPGFDGDRVAAGVDYDLKRLGLKPPKWIHLEVDPGIRAGSIPLARSFDSDEGAGKLVEALEAFGESVECLVAPPLLGLERHAELREAASKAVGAPVVEALGHVPSVPGVRFQRALIDMASRDGIESVKGVKDLSWEGNEVVGANLEDGTTLEVDAVILATGRFVAGGVRWDHSIKENLLGLPVISELGPMEVGSPHAVVRRRPEESHPLMTAGVQVNSRLQPMREGKVAFDNVFAAGMLIGGFASRYALCADGVALSTGVVAAEEALRGLG